MMHFEGPNAACARRARWWCLAAALACGVACSRLSGLDDVSLGQPDSAMQPPSGTGGADVAGGSGGAGGGIDGSGGGGGAMAPVNVPFDSSGDLAGWSTLNANQLQDQMPEVTNGTLVLSVADDGGQRFPAFFEEANGPGMVRPWDGDVVIETRCRARERGNPTEPSAHAFSGAGIVILDPTGGPPYRNYYFVEVGREDTNLGIMVKVTGGSPGMVRSDRQFQLPSLSWREATLRLCRRGNTVTAYYRQADSGAFTQAIAPGSASRLILPPLVHLALVASDYANGGVVAPTLRAEFDYVRVTPLGPGQDCLDPP